MVTANAEYREFDSKGRTVVYRDGEALQYEREFDDDWSSELPAHVVEYSYGKKIYERHYDQVVVNEGFTRW